MFYISKYLCLVEQTISDVEEGGRGAEPENLSEGLTGMLLILINQRTFYLFLNAKLKICHKRSSD